jgi:hypothetical protein
MSKARAGVRSNSKPIDAERLVPPVKLALIKSRRVSGTGYRQLRGINSEQV